MLMFRFDCKEIQADILSDKQKVQKYKQVNVCSDNETNARIKAKLDDSYCLLSWYELGEDW